MKYFKLYMLATVLSIVGVACKSDLDVYNHPHDGLNLSGQKGVDFSFVYSDANATRDTVWVPVTTMGFIHNRDRVVTFEQAPIVSADSTGPGFIKEPAVPGVHYVAFDDPELRKQYVVKADSNSAMIPVILKRDPSLQKKSVNLKIRVAAGADFRVGRQDQSTINIIITDQLAKPKHWTRYLGVYGQVKHRWLIETTGEKWNDGYLYDVLGMNSDVPFWMSPINANYDEAFFKYLTEKLQNQLKAYNDQQVANGKDKLAEEDKTLVKIW